MNKNERYEEFKDSFDESVANDIAKALKEIEEYRKELRELHEEAAQEFDPFELEMLVHKMHHTKKYIKIKKEYIKDLMWTASWDVEDMIEYLGYVGIKPKHWLLDMHEE